MTMATSIPMDEIRGLVEERARYEAWLHALDAKRGGTSAHVFERVQQDYQGRLRRVVESLGEHVPSLRTSVAELESRHEEVMRLLAVQHDELAEAELRVLVGEFAPEEGERRRHEAGQEIQRLEGERDAVAAELEGVRGMLGRATAEIEEPAAPAIEAAAVEPEAVSPAIEPAAAEPVAASSPMGDAEVLTQAFAAADAAPEMGDPDGRAYAGGAAAQHFAPPLHPPAAAVPPAFEPREVPREVPPARPLSPFATDVGPLVTPPAAFAAQTAPEGGPQQKTLRCEECGEMNYPTEWYCERCGGELAAL